MKPLKPANPVPGEDRQVAAQLLQKWREGDPMVRQVITTCKESEAIRAIEEFINEEVRGSELFKNDVYQVAVRYSGDTGVHLSIKRIDRQPIHDWRDLQEIKNQLVGPECEGVELYPAETRVVDTANQYHLWVCTNPKFRFPFGFEVGYKTETPMGKAVNRPFA